MTAASTSSHHLITRAQRREEACILCNEINSPINDALWGINEELRKQVIRIDHRDGERRGDYSTLLPRTHSEDRP